MSIELAKKGCQNGELMRSPFAPLLLLVLSGCAKTKTDYVAPPGFTPEDTTEVAMAPATFVEAGGRLVSASVVDREKHRQAAGLADEDPSTDPDDRGKLEVILGSTYADGMQVGISRRPRAWARFKPVGASAEAEALPRNDGSVVAYEEAYPGVTAAFGGTTRRLKEYLRAETPGSAPELRYVVEAGPEFGQLRAGEEGELWGHDSDGSALFAMPAPLVKDATGKVVHGTWELGQQDGHTTVHALLSYEGLTYPLMIDPSFDTPLWVVDTTDQPPARAGAAIAWVRSRNEAVLFGGVGSGNTYLQDTHVRYVATSLFFGDTTAWSGEMNAPTKPTRRAYAAMATRDTTSTVYMFGGHTIDGKPTDEMWKLTLTSSTATWSPVTKTATWPKARFMHGMAALDDSTLLMFGGVDGQGNNLTDTWKWNGSTWSQACTACFPGTYGFTTVPGRASKGAGRDAPVVFGGFNGTGFVDTVSRWNGTTWVTPSITPALVPTNDDGTIATTASTGTVSPQARYLGFGFWSPTGNILLGGGFRADAVSQSNDVYINDLWSWEAPLQSGGDRWVRQTSNSPLGAPGVRYSPSTVFFDLADDGTISNASPFGLMFGGATGATASTLVQSTRLYRGFNDSVSMTVRTRANPSRYELSASTGFPRKGGYFVRRVPGSQWELVPSCGSPTNPLTVDSGDLTCTVTVSANSTATAFGVLIRDRDIYATVSGGNGNGCVQSTRPEDVTDVTLCGTKTAYPGQAICGVTGLGSTPSCPKP